jgi:hypothetical protein
MRVSRILILGLSILAVGCSSKKSGGSGGSTGYITISADKASVVANGTNTVTLTINNTTGTAASITTDRGTFPGGVTTASVSAASATLTLTTCDASAGGCTGTAHVSANAGSLSGSTAIAFVSLATACNTNCATDAGCSGLTCTPTGGSGAATCTGTWPALSCVVSSGGGGGGGGGTGALGSVVPGDPAFLYPVLGATGSGFQEFGWLQVRVLDDTGKAFADGTTVHFEHVKLGGSTLAAPTVACTVPSASCVAHDSVTAGGIASVWIYSGTVAGTLQVTATVTAGGVTRSLSLPTVAVVGAKASAANFAIECSPRNVPALADTNCSWSHVDAPYTCVALAKDRYNNLLGRATQVIFVSEAAGVGQVATTPEYDPTKDPVGQTDVGSAIEIFKTLGGRLPYDVLPAAGEPNVTTGTAGNPDPCPTNADGFSRTRNPRDGVVTVIAIADGEEAFVDLNGNGKYDAGEPFIDLGEPFVDANDNGVWDDGTVPGVAREWFLDVNGNGQYDGPNGVWDANTKIWTQTIVLFTGVPRSIDAGGGNLIGTRWADLGASACAPSPPATPFSVDAKVTGPPEIPPTIDIKRVFASDLNLNLTSNATQYEVVVESSGKVKATYYGLAQYADLFGMSYRYWPCDKNGANCAEQCRATGATVPCTMKPTLSAYSCGASASVMITGGESASGAEFVDWNVTMPYPRYGSGVDWLWQSVLSGTNN